MPKHDNILHYVYKMGAVPLLGICMQWSEAKQKHIEM